MATNTAFESTVILLTKEGMGHADAGLQKQLLQKYLQLLDHNGKLPGAICFMTEGVKLVSDGSDFLPILQVLESKGVHLIICQTCLNHFDLAGKVKVGVVGGMGDILAAQVKASKVITL